MPILTPLQDVAVHVVKTPGVWFLLHYRVRFISWIPGIPGKLSQTVLRAKAKNSSRGNLLSETIGRRCSCTARIFPLGFGWQTIRLIVFRTQFLDELLAIIPGNLFHGKVLFALETTGIVAHHGLPLFLGDKRNAHVIAFGQCDLVLGFVSLLSFSSYGLPIMNVPGGIQANFMARLLVMISPGLRLRSASSFSRRFSFRLGFRLLESPLFRFFLLPTFPFQFGYFLILSLLFRFFLLPTFAFQIGLLTSFILVFLPGVQGFQYLQHRLKTRQAMLQFFFPALVEHVFQVECEGSRQRNSSADPLAPSS